MQNLSVMSSSAINKLDLSSKKLCFVLPRYWIGIAGGAETLCGQLAEKLVAQGAEITIATTCAKDNRTWENHFHPGTTNEGGIKVIRFPVSARNLEKWIPLQIKISENKFLEIDEQLDWIEHSVNSRELCRFILENGDSYDAFFFGPYLFGTTFWGSQIHPHKSYLVPCLHDEEYAYLDITREMFRNVKGCLFNASAEMHLARRLYGDLRGSVVGLGFDPKLYDPKEYDTAYFENKFPYVVYIGRKETGKNVQLLIDYFIKFKEGNPGELKLVIAGGGDFADLHRPGVLERDDIIDIGHLSETDKKKLIRHSLFLCQPSVNESFSIVIMEAWLLDVPVVVHAGCAVTREHVIESGGGLYFADYNDFEQVVNHLSHVNLDNFRSNGSAYVNENYSWQRIVEKFSEALIDV